MADTTRSTYDLPVRTEVGRKSTTKCTELLSDCFLVDCVSLSRRKSKIMRFPYRPSSRLLTSGPVNRLLINLV
jgi:hypothetical protein